jgi:hypothetical protein
MGKIVELVNKLEPIKGVKKLAIDGYDIRIDNRDKKKFDSGDILVSKDKKNILNLGIEYPCKDLPKRAIYNNKTNKYINVKDLTLLYDILNPAL